METPLISSIQRFCVHDGDGIRTTVFFKGCALRCPWCHNPETQSFCRELLRYPERCTGCSCCIPVCVQQAVSLCDGLAVRDAGRCVACGACAEACPNDAVSVSGLSYPVDALVRLLCRDSMFFETSGGGVTLSGGEVMQQPFAYVRELVQKLHARGVSVAVDTCGDAPYDRFQQLLPYVSCFLYDLKHMDAAEHRRLTGVDTRRILDNAAALLRDGARVVVRIPLVAGVNDGEENIGSVIGFLRRQAPPERVCLLPYHTAGSQKYLRLGREKPDAAFAPPDAARLDAIAQCFRSAGFAVQIGG